MTPEQRVWRVIEDWVEGYEMRACVTDFMQNQLVEQILTATKPEDEACPVCGFSSNDYEYKDITSPISNLTCQHTKLTEGCDCCFEWATGTPSTEPEDDGLTPEVRQDWATSGALKNVTHTEPKGELTKEQYKKLYGFNPPHPEDNTEPEDGAVKIISHGPAEIYHTEPEDEWEDGDPIHPGPY